MQISYILHELQVRGEPACNEYEIIKIPYKPLRVWNLPWKVGVLYTAHKILHTYAIILFPSSNDAYGPLLSSYCHQAIMHIDPVVILLPSSHDAYGPPLQ